MPYGIAILAGYLLGCLNLAHLLARRRGVDLSHGGSGNRGASNAAILMGWRAGILVALHDVGKAVVAVLGIFFLFPALPEASLLAGVACVLGHVFPVFMGFRGGKGFAPFIGVILAVDWRFGMGILLAAVAVTVIFDYIVIGTTIAVVAFPLFLAFSGRWTGALFVCAASVVILWKHRVNFVRIRNRTEIGLRSTLKGEHKVK